MKSTNTSIRAILLFVASFLMSATLFSQDNCDIEFGAKKNRNSKNVSIHGSAYRMVMTNNGDAADIYTLSVKDINGSCENPDGSSSSANVVLGYEFLDANNNKITSISINPGETVNFLVSVIVPNTGTVGRWSCVEIVASSSNCSDYSSGAILQSKVISPNQE